MAGTIGAMTEDYDARYAELIGPYQQALAAGDDKLADGLAWQITQTARGLLFTAVRRGHGGQYSSEVAEDAVTDALMDVLAMARTFDPGRNVTFSQWLKSRNAPWRATLAASLDAATYRTELKPTEKRVLALAYATIADFRQRTGREPSSVELQELLEKAMAEREEDNAEAAARNVRSGFSAAARDVQNLLTGTRTPVHPDTAGEDGQDMWDAVMGFDQDPTASKACEQDDSAKLARLAGVDLGDVKLSAKERERAMARMGSPHAQFAFLAARAVQAGSAP